MAKWPPTQEQVHRFYERERREKRASQIRAVRNLVLTVLVLAAVVFVLDHMTADAFVALVVMAGITALLIWIGAFSR